jgi:hypothetical protein
MFEETLRIDYSNHILGMRLNFWIATILFVGSLLWFVAIQRGWTRRGRSRPDVALFDPERSSEDSGAVRGRKAQAKQIA